MWAISILDVGQSSGRRACGSKVGRSIWRASSMTILISPATEGYATTGQRIVGWGCMRRDTARGRASRLCPSLVMPLPPVTQRNACWGGAVTPCATILVSVWEVMLEVVTFPGGC